jgi:ABC-type multidrug transport system ATPase subunit
VPERLGGKVIEAKNLTKAYGDKLLFEDLSFSLPPGGIVGIIGPNGAGKTTLFRMITGQEQPDSGRSASARRCTWAMSTRAATSRSQQECLGGNLRRATITFRFGKQV